MHQGYFRVRLSQFLFIQNQVFLIHGQLRFYYFNFRYLHFQDLYRAIHFWEFFNLVPYSARIQSIVCAVLSQLNYDYTPMIFQSNQLAFQNFVIDKKWTLFNINSFLIFLIIFFFVLAFKDFTFLRVVSIDKNNILINFPNFLNVYMGIFQSLD